MRGISIGLGWLGGYYLLAQYGVHLLPASVARATTLPEYLAMVQIVSILFGVTTALALTRGHGSLRAAFFPEVATQRARSEIKLLSVVLLSAPPIYLLAHGLGMYLAFETLIAEIAARGARAVQEQTGELGRSSRADTLWTIVPFTVVLAPLGEELLFRGGIYGAVLHCFRAKEPDTELPPPSLEVAGLPPKSGVIVRLHGWGGKGGYAVLVSSVVFGLMHADVHGGMGIVRLTSASVLGLACGLTRHLSGGLFAPVLLHVAYNLVSLSTLRGWIVFQSWPTKYAIPTILVPISVACAFVLGLLLAAGRKPFSSREANQNLKSETEQ